ncbi:LysR family transcriptional regulator [Paenibacillus tyrfis]|uniref:LysR family transcriptional regulator n=1 Tax=Paenibacillus tyrfis TaxID=1501230 RepID=UPI0020A21EF0|nr:LysR family transcriptional regulator [Paenibacillus tyrfis]MCP1309284.1 LysR family transcriptional regulator [Paenibacillus tyrfis]
MTHSQIQLFVKIAETGSFTKAGHELNMTQPAVSRAVSTLEAELGVTLLIRDRRNGIILTDIGERLLIVFRDILQGFEKVEQEVMAEKGFEVGTIRIGSFPSASAYFLPKIFRVIGEKYPRIQFDLYEGTIDDLRERLASRMIDVAFLIPPHDEFEITPLLKEEMFLFIRDDHPLAGRSTIHLQELSDEAMIICNGGYEIPIYERFREAGACLQVKYIVHNVNTSLNMIQEGLGVAIMSNISISLSTLPPNVRMHALTPHPYREINLAVPSLQEASIAVKLFIQTARDLFAKS